MKAIPLIISLLFSAGLFSQTTLPVPDHIVVLILENHAYSQIIGSSAAPHINSLAIDGCSALFTKSYAIGHPSQPNYLHLYSGCDQGVTDDNVPSGIPFTTANLGRQLIDAGKTFVTYSEDLPSVGFNGATSGDYERKHNPAANWMGTGKNQIPAITNQPFTAFPSTDFTQLPTVCYVVPNQNNDMHNGTDPSSITISDNWIYNNLFSYIQWAKTHNSLFILTFDEDNFTPLNHIVTIFAGQMVSGGEYTQTINHYSVLRTIEEMHNLSYACNASTSNAIKNCWTITTATKQTEMYNNCVLVYPNPAKKYFTVDVAENILLTNLSIALINNLGETVKDVAIFSYSSTIQTNGMASGIYYFRLSRDKKCIKTGIIIVE